MAKGALHTVGRSSRGAQRERFAVCVRGHRGRYLGRRISACSNLTPTAGHGGLHLLPPYPSVPHPRDVSFEVAGRPFILSPGVRVWLLRAFGSAPLGGSEGELLGLLLVWLRLFGGPGRFSQDSHSKHLTVRNG